MQTLVISRLIIGMLLIPMALIIGCVVAVILTFYALAVHPLLALFVIACSVAIIVGLAKWESWRVTKDIPRDD
jgi:hypothetical protein